MKINNNIRVSFLVFFSLCLLQSCIKEEHSDKVTTTPVTSTELQIVTAYGTITDSDKMPISNAVVNLVNNIGEDQRFMTDDNGYYEFFDLLIKGETLIVSVDAGGTFFEEFHVPVVNKSIIRGDIELTEKELLGTFDSADGGTLSDNSTELSFPANAIVNSNGDLHTGIVNVYVGVNDPLRKDNSSVNNGAAISMNASNEFVSKISFRNIHVELTDQNGNILEISDEHSVLTKVALQNNGSSELSNRALTLMHYDTEKHLWVEETTGEIKDGHYIASLPHFSSWTWCEFFTNPLDISGSVNLLENGVPFNAISYVVIDFDIASFLINPAENGDFVLKYGPSEIPFELRILNECEEIIYSQSYPSSLLGLDLGVLDIESTSINKHSISVDVYNCDSTSVSQGVSRLCIDGLDQNSCQLVSIENGNVQFSFPDCVESLSGELFLLNEDNLMTTEPISFNLDDQNIVLPYVTLCDTFKNEIIVNVNGSLFYSSHVIGYTASFPGNGFVSSDGESTGISISTNNNIDGLGNYELKFANLGNADSSIYVKDWSPVGSIEILEFIPNSEAIYEYPEHLVGSFQGTVEQIDAISGAVIGTLTIDGTINID